MSRRHAVLVLLALVLPTLAFGAPRALTYVTRIGAGWGDNASATWMSFVAFSPDGRMIAGDPDGLVLSSFPAGRLIRRIPDATSISPGWKYVASNDGVWSLETGKQAFAISNGANPILAFDPRDRYLAEAPTSPVGAGPRIHIIDLTSGAEVGAFGAHADRSLAFSPDGATLAAGHWDGVTLWRPRTGAKLAVLRGVGRYVVGLAFSRDGRRLAVGTDLGGLEVWDVRRRERLWKAQLGGLDVSNPAFSPNGRLVAAGVYGEGSVWLLGARDGRVIDHQQVSDLGCGSVAFSPDGRYLITPSTGGLVTWPHDRGGTVRVFRVRAP